MKGLFALVFMLLLTSVSQSQTGKDIDSLEAKLKNTTNKKEQVQLMNNIGWAYKNSDPEKAMQLHKKALQLAKEIQYKRGEAISYKDIGIIKEYKAEYDSALYYLNLALDIYKSQNATLSIANIQSDMATVYNYMGQFDKAIELALSSVKIKEQEKQWSGVATTLNNIGVIYAMQSLFEQAKEYFDKGLEFAEKSEKEDVIATSLNNVARLSMVMGNVDEAIKLYDKLIDVSKKLKDDHQLALIESNLGECYFRKEDYNSAIKHYEEAVKIQERMGDLYNLAGTYEKISAIYGVYNQYDLRLEYLNKSVSIAEKAGAKDLLEELYGIKAEAYFDNRDYYNAFIYEKRSADLRDTIRSDENMKHMNEMESKYQSEKKDLEIKNLEVEQEKKDAQLKQEKTQRYALFGGLALILLFAIILFNRLKVTKKQKGIIVKQKEVVDHAYGELEEKNKEILDSINYAKRIQSAILPPDKLVKEYLEESFILYKPKDIVAGDFYWMEHKKGKVLFAAADCTGHGVPGAMVSVVCNNGLNRSVREYGITDPGKILDKTREIVIQEFEKSEEEVKDGMDIAICSLEGNTLQYAGANNPLWIVRKGTTELEQVEEIKPDKQPIGKYADTTPFTTHTIQLNKGDSFYIFSDGYPDQFGGPNGKKLKYRPFRKMLLENVAKPMEEQRTILDNAFEKWKGSLEQIDDVCIIGVKV